MIVFNHMMKMALTNAVSISQVELKVEGVEQCKTG